MSLRKYNDKIRNKHDGGVFYNSIYEFYVRLYTKVLFRKVVHSIPSYTQKLPSKMIFLVGCYNSGTTILRDILKSHPDIDGMPREGVKFTNVFPDMQHGGWIRMAYRNRSYPDSYFSEDEVRNMLNRDWGFWHKKDSSFFLEKSITHSFRVPFLQKLFPEACFIAITRDGYCSTEGVLRRAKPKGKAIEKLKSEFYPVELCAQQWAHINKLLLSAKNEGVRIKHIMFENFVVSPYQVLTDIFKFIGVDEKVLSENASVISISGRNFKIKNPNPASRQRFLEENIEAFNKYAGELMHYFDYPLMGDA